MTFAEPWLIGAAAAIALLFALAIVAGERRTRAAALDYSSLAFLDAALGRGVPWTGIFAALWIGVPPVVTAVGWDRAKYLLPIGIWLRVLGVERVIE